MKFQYFLEKNYLHKHVSPGIVVYVTQFMAGTDIVVVVACNVVWATWIHNGWPTCKLLQFIVGFKENKSFKRMPNFAAIDQHESLTKDVYVTQLIKLLPGLEEITAWAEVDCSDGFVGACVIGEAVDVGFDNNWTHIIWPTCKLLQFTFKFNDISWFKVIPNLDAIPQHVSPVTAV